jgi:ankyrin repeat protein
VWATGTARQLDSRCCGEENIEAVKEHLAAGTDVNAKDSVGRTPLHFAAWEGHKGIVELLIVKVECSPKIEPDVMRVGDA